MENKFASKVLNVNQADGHISSSHMNKGDCALLLQLLRVSVHNHLSLKMKAIVGFCVENNPPCLQNPSWNNSQRASTTLPRAAN